MINDSAAPQNEIGFQDFKRIMIRRKWTIVVCLAIALAGAGVATVSLPPLYRTTVRIFAQPQQPNQSFATKDPVERTIAEASAPEVQNQIEVLQSASILEQAFEAAGVTIPPEALDPDAKSGPVNVKEVGVSDAVDISVDLPSAVASTNVATQIPKVFSTFLSAGTAAEFKTSVGFLTDRLETEQGKLNDAVNELAKYRNARPLESGTTVTDNEARTDRLSRAVAQYQASLSDLANARKRYETLVAARKNLPPTVPSPSVVANTERKAAEQRIITDLQDKLADARTQYAEDSPFVKSYKDQLANEDVYLKQLPKKESNDLLQTNPLIPQYDQNVATAKAAFEGAQAAANQLSASVAEETKAMKDYATSAPIEQKLLTEITLRTTSVQDLSLQLDQVRVRTTSSHDPVSVLAITAPSQVQPAPVKYTIIAILIGLAAGVLAALAKDKFDDRVFSMDQIYAISGVPPLGQLPASNKTLALTSGTARNPLLENYRALRFNLDSIAEGGAPVKSVLIASPSGLERRSDLSFNLAVEAATDQRATILVDADLRNPKLHEQLGARLAPGLSDVLRGAVTLEEALQSTSNPKLRFLSAGSPEEDPLQLLASPEMETLHNDLKSSADVIILNSSSLLRHADARALAKILDSVLFVARSGATKLTALRYCVDLLRRAKAPLLGIVLSESGGYSDVPYYGRD